jgi:hypothetical protein
MLWVILSQTCLWMAEKYLNIAMLPWQNPVVLLNCPSCHLDWTRQSGLSLYFFPAFMWRGPFKTDAFMSFKREELYVSDAGSPFVCTLKLKGPHARRRLSYIALSST